MAKKPLFDDEQPKDMDETAVVAADPSILTAEEISAVEAEAKAEVELEAKDKAKDALKAKLVKQAKRKAGLAEEQVSVTVDLAPYCDRILLDNKAYLQGVTYTVGASVAMVMREIMQRTWGHQSEIDGKSENFYRRTRGQRVIPAGNGAAVVNTSNLLRA